MIKYDHVHCTHCGRVLDTEILAKVYDCRFIGACEHCDLFFRQPPGGGQIEALRGFELRRSA
jgi:hypothetical protein